MRMDPTHGEPVAAWLARAGLDEIRQVIATFGEERFARRVAQAIVSARRTKAIGGTGELAAIVSAAVRTREPGKHPATRTFQALRIFINDELGALESALAASLKVLAPGGRLAVISFHSLEDRLVKRFMQRAATVDAALAHLPVVPPAARPSLRIVGKKLRAQSAEVARNPRARSALLRVAERLA
jgi:16S rRNA (cytosine1402-N4)-methyltransferase